MSTRIIRVRDTGSANGRPSSVTLKRWEDAGLFPPRRAFGLGIVGWSEEEFKRGLEGMANQQAVQAEQRRRQACNAYEAGRKAKEATLPGREASNG